ncbi:hypothetical protein ATO1_08855 [Phaeobacter sp. 22II1-1F12B]|nr:hypothetical protein ATO1_08855 [Phaeobacter sp. 22II1-1F12B]
MNTISVRRKALSERDAVTVHVMKLQGDTYTDIVQQMGTNANRIGEVLRSEVHPSTHIRAVELLKREKLILL